MRRADSPNSTARPGRRKEQRYGTRSPRRIAVVVICFHILWQRLHSSHGTGLIRSWPDRCAWPEAVRGDHALFLDNKSLRTWLRFPRSQDEKDPRNGIREHSEE